MARPVTTPAPAPSTERRLLQVGQIAKQTGKTVRAIRFYEELGLVTPAHRTRGGFRKYDSSMLVRIHWIDRLQVLGFSLRDIRDFLSTLRDEDHGPRAMDHLRAFYAKKLIETRDTVTRLQALESELNESLAYLAACQTCSAETLKSACRTCQDDEHQGTTPPILIAAVHDPA